LTRDRGEQVVGPFAGFLMQTISSAWKTYRSYSTDQLVVNSRRTRASSVSDLMQMGARANLPPGMVHVKVKGLSLFAIGGEAVLRFKKLRSSLLTSNYPTQQALRFDGQRAVLGVGRRAAGRQLSLSFSEPVHLNCGYVLNRTETAIEAMYVTCTAARGRLSWTIDLAKLAGAQPVPVITPKSPTLPPAPPVRVRAGVLKFPKANEDGKE
jgi:hypothetical protein